MVRRLVLKVLRCFEGVTTLLSTYEGGVPPHRWTKGSSEAKLMKVTLINHLCKKWDKHGRNQVYFSKCPSTPLMYLLVPSSGIRVTFSYIC